MTTLRQSRPSVQSPPAMQVHPPREDLRPWFVTLPDLSGETAWAELFADRRPVEIDVGCGRGLFLYNESLVHPERNFVGIEIDYKEGRRTATRLKKRAAANARVVGGDVREAFLKLVPPRSVAVVHVYCPDPWWKKKHRKRRVFTDSFVDQVAEVLEPDGLLSSASDVEEYFDVIRGLMDHHPGFEPVPPASDAPPTDPPTTTGYRTSFEKKALERGTPIHRGLWRLRTASGSADAR